MGGLRSKTPITFVTLLARHWRSPDSRSRPATSQRTQFLKPRYGRSPVLYWIGVVTAGMTAFYVFRSIFMTFFGEFRGHGEPHESPISMTGPLMVLAVLSLAGGFINVGGYLEPMFAATHHAAKRR